MSIIYDLIFFAAVIIYLPIYLFKKKFHRGFFLRLGILPKNLALDRPIWIHAVSVGEAMAVRGLADELRKAFPNKRLVISTVTSTGNKIAKRMAGEGDFVTYLPLDFSFIVRNVIDRINPSVFIIAETELWPNLISCLYQKNVPAIVVNGRISDSSFKGYLAIKFLIKPILNKITVFCVQANRDAQRLISLGVSKNKINITGNMKFDVVFYKIESSALARHRQSLGLSFSDRLFVCGSTHPGEEKAILEVYKALQKKFSNLKLIIAPRHPERAAQVEKLIIQYNFKPVRISQLDPTPQAPHPTPIFILDTVGQLINYYAIADIVFVGGSLVKTGGHNILEPASLDKPVIFGAHMFNFRDIAELFLINNAAISVHNQEELKIKIIYLLQNPPRVTELTLRAKELILSNQGATRRNLEFIRQQLCRG
jgi:3-deoxy-D-manno-octulosonic-acid transferase